jgi:acid phosphatase
MQASNLVPFTEFQVDLANQALPNYSFLLPNIEHDAHPCIISRAACDDASLLRAADQWLQTNLVPLLLSPLFQPGGNGLLLVVFDEARDNAHGGGHVAAVLVGPNVVPGTQSSTFHQHQDMLRLICTTLGISTCPGLAVAAPDLQEFFP